MYKMCDTQLTVGFFFSEKEILFVGSVVRRDDFFKIGPFSTFVTTESYKCLNDHATTLFTQKKNKFWDLSHRFPHSFNIVVDRGEEEFYFYF